MSRIQKLFAAVLPKRWMAVLEAHSRAWILECSCGRVTSVWETGGIRYRAAGKRSLFIPCPNCGWKSHRLSKKEMPTP